MEKIRDFSRRSPVWFSVALTLLVILIHEVLSRIHASLPDSIGIDIAYQLLFMAWPVALVVLFGFSFIFRQRGLRATMRAGMPLLLMYAGTLVSFIASRKADPTVDWKSPAEMILGVIMLIGVGFREEVIFRGIACNAIARKYAHSVKGIWLTALASGAVFGALHMGNLLNGVTLQGALSQTLGAFGTGVLFCAIYLRGGSIWVMALIHSLMNAVGAVDALFVNAESLSSVINSMDGLSQLILLLPNFLMAAYLLRKSKRQKILDRMQKLRDEILV
jgi:membrane protease YdiL (CAAX protease family)